MKRIGLFVILISLMVTLGVSAQEINPQNLSDIDPQLNISFPPPVYIVSGNSFPVAGTANLENMIDFFVEYRPLTFGLEETDIEPLWFPLSAPNPQSIIQGILGNWDTTLVTDGLYEIRLTANTATGVEHALVSPLRVENSEAPFVQAEAEATEETITGIDVPTLIPTSTQQPQQPPNRPTLQPTPTRLGGGTGTTGNTNNTNNNTTPTTTANTTAPQAIADLNANVRQGDSTVFEIVGSLSGGQGAPIIGISNTGSGWYYVELPTGRRGFVSPTVVRVVGSTANLQTISPPPLPAPTTIPATPTPVSTINLVPALIQIAPHPMVCGQASEIQITVRNTGTTATTAGGTISVAAVLGSTGESLGGTVTVFPALGPGEEHIASAFLTVSTFHGELQRIVVNVDANQAIAETNEGDNTSSVNTDYVLQQGNCP